MFLIFCVGLAAGYFLGDLYGLDENQSVLLAFGWAFYGVLIFSIGDAVDEIKKHIDKKFGDKQ